MGMGTDGEHRKSLGQRVASTIGVSTDRLRVVTYAGAILLRLSLLGFGAIMDATQRVRFSDVDYAVYSDASALVLQGRSPFERATYRYTPLLAFLLTPNVLGFPSFGKVREREVCRGSAVLTNANSPAINVASGRKDCLCRRGHCRNLAPFAHLRASRSV